MNMQYKVFILMPVYKPHKLGQGLQGLLLHDSIRRPFAEEAHAAVELARLG